MGCLFKILYLLGLFFIIKLILRINRHLNKINGEEDTNQNRTIFVWHFGQILGKIAKSDGRVSQNEIQVVEHYLNNFNLTPELIEIAIKGFNKAKDDDIPLETYVTEFAGNFTDPAIRQIMLLAMVQVVCADGTNITQQEFRLLIIAQQILRQPNGTVEHLISMTFARQNRGQYYNRQNHRQKPENNLQSDYALLGVSPNAPDSTIKKAYRKKAMELHPDRLQAKGLPEKMVSLATQQLTEINAAYDRICKSRKI